MAKTNGTALQKAELPRKDAEFQRDLSHQMLGAAKYANFLHQQTGSDLLRFLIAVRDEKRYLDYDCNNFDEFLNSGHSPISQKTFYRQLDLFKAEGERYDLMEEWRVPARVRRLLIDGDFSLDGNNVVIGEQLVPLSEETVIRQAFETLVKDRIASRKKIENLTGYKERYEQLKAQVNVAAEEPEYVTAFKQATNALQVMIAEVKDLPGDMKGERGPLDLPVIYLLLEQLIREFGEPLPWPHGSWNVDRPNSREQAQLAYFQSDAIDGDNF